MQCGRLWPAVDCADAHEDVVEARLGVLHRHVEVAAAVEDARVDQLELGLGTPPPHVLPRQLLVGEGGLRVLVEKFHVGVGRGGVEVEVVLLHILPMVPLAPAEAEQPLLKDVVVPVPQGEGEAEPLVIVTDAADPVLTPAIGTGAGMIVREILPGGPGGAVVFAHGSPLTLGQIWPPASPVGSASLGFEQTLLLWNHRELDALTREEGSPGALAMMESAGAAGRLFHETILPAIANRGHPP